jgi:hypothetical protein
LFVEQFRIKLVFGPTRNKDHFKAVGSLVVGCAAGCVAIGNGAHLEAHLEEEEVVWQAMLVMTKRHRQNVKDGLFVKLELDVRLVGTMN